VNCKNCKWARLAGNKGDDIVGCALLANDAILIKDVKQGPVFQGWLYNNRLPHEKEGGNRAFDGAMTYGPNLVASYATCYQYEHEQLQAG